MEAGVCGRWNHIQMMLPQQLTHCLENHHSLDGTVIIGKFLLSYDIFVLYKSACVHFAHSIDSRLPQESTSRIPQGFCVIIFFWPVAIRTFHCAPGKEAFSSPLLHDSSEHWLKALEQVWLCWSHLPPTSTQLPAHEHSSTDTQRNIHAYISRPTWQPCWVGLSLVAQIKPTNRSADRGYHQGSWYLK